MSDDVHRFAYRDLMEIPTQAPNPERRRVLRSAQMLAQMESEAPKGIIAEIETVKGQAHD